MCRRPPPRRRGRGKHGGHAHAAAALAAPATRVTSRWRRRARPSRGHDSGEDPAHEQHGAGTVMPTALPTARPRCRDSGATGTSRARVTAGRRAATAGRQLGRPPKQAKTPGVTDLAEQPEAVDAHDDAVWRCRRTRRRPARRARGWPAANSAQEGDGGHDQQHEPRKSCSTPGRSASGSAATGPARGRRRPRP